MIKNVFITQICLLVGAAYTANKWGITIPITLVGFILLNLIVFQITSIAIHVAWYYKNPHAIEAPNKIGKALAVLIISVFMSGNALSIVRNLAIEGPHIKLSMLDPEETIYGLINSRKAFEFAATLDIPLSPEQKKRLTRCPICNIIYYTITVLCLILPGILPFRNAFIENCNKIKHFIKEFNTPQMYRIKSTLPTNTISYLQALSKILEPSYKSLSS